MPTSASEARPFTWITNMIFFPASYSSIEMLIRYLGNGGEGGTRGDLLPLAILTSDSQHITRTVRDAYHVMVVASATG